MANEIKIQGDKRLIRLLDSLGSRAVPQALRSGVNASLNPVLKAARSEAPQETGLLRKSLKKKIKTYQKGSIVAGIVGAAKSVSSEVATPGGKVKKRIPAKYIQLVEQGHAGPHPAAAHPFLQPAYERTTGVAVETLQTKFASSLEAKARKG